MKMIQRFPCLWLAAVFAVLLCACATADAPIPPQTAPIETEGELTTAMEHTKQTATPESRAVLLRFNGTEMLADIAKNSSGDAFLAWLAEGPVTVSMEDYGNFEKVGPLSRTLPRNDEPITTEAGDLILYLGNRITVYYDTNSWTFTRLGRIRDADGETLKAALGSGTVEITFSLP